MDIKEFEALKKKFSDLQLKKAKEDTKLEEIERKLDENKKQLAELGVQDLENLDSLISQKEKELEEQYNTLSELLKQFET